MHPTHRAYILKASTIVGLATCFYLYEFFLRVMPSVITVELAQDFHISQALLGQFIATFFYAYAIMQIPAGLLCDKYGPKYCLTVAISTCAIATFILQYTDSFIIASCARLAIGAVSACAFVGPLTLASRWFTPKYQALIAGCVQVMGCMGAIFAGQPIALIVQTYSWRTSLYYTAWLGTLLAILFHLILLDSPKMEDKKVVEKPLNIKNVLTQVIGNTQSWAVGVLAFGSWAAIAIFAESWGIPYLSKLQNITTDQAAEQAMWIWIAMAIMSPLAGFASNYFQNRKWPIMILLSIGLVASTLLVSCPPQQAWLVSLLLFAIGCSSAAQPITFGLVNDNNTQTSMATAIAFNNMALVSSAMILQPLIGYILDIYQGLQAEPTLLGYQIAFMCVPVSITISMIACLLWVKETHCQNIAKPMEDLQENAETLQTNTA